MNAAEQLDPAASCSSVTISVPPLLVAVLDELVVKFAERHGETAEQARRAVEIGVLQRGLLSLQEELGKP